MILMGKEIGIGHKPFYVAELSQNYSNFEEARSLIYTCQEAGADAIKVQIIIPWEMTLLDCDKPDFICKEGLWKGQKLGKLYKSTPEYLNDLFMYGETIGIPVFASVFGFESIRVAEQYGCPAYKISSFENNWPELIQACRDTGKPLLISTGLTQYKDIVYDDTDIVMHCISSYPCPLANADLSKIQWLQDYPHVGFSDHTIGTKAAEYAVALGACVIEKHVTLSNNTVDSAFSARPDEFARLVKNCNQAWEAVNGGTREVDRPYVQYKRSIYVTRDIAEGEAFGEGNIAVIRPSYGLSPDRFNIILGKVATKNLQRGDALTEEDVKW